MAKLSVHSTLDEGHDPVSWTLKIRSTKGTMEATEMNISLPLATIANDSAILLRTAPASSVENLATIKPNVDLKEPGTTRLPVKVSIKSTTNTWAKTYTTQTQTILIGTSDKSTPDLLEGELRFEAVLRTAITPLTKTSPCTRSLSSTKTRRRPGSPTQGARL